MVDGVDAEFSAVFDRCGGSHEAFLREAIRFLRRKAGFIDGGLLARLAHQEAAPQKVAEPELGKAENKEEKLEMDKAENKEEELELGKAEKIVEEEAAPLGNGGTTDRYTWTQSLSELTVALEVDAGLRSRDLIVELLGERVSVRVKGKQAIVEGKFPHKILPDDSTWTLEQESGKKTKTLTLFIRKFDQMSWWKCVIVGDPEIDTSKIVPENSKLDQLDGETRQMVEKMMVSTLKFS